MYRTMHGEYGYYSRIQSDQIIRCAHNVARDYNLAARIEFRRDPEDAWTFWGYVEPSGRVHRVDDDVQDENLLITAHMRRQPTPEAPRCIECGRPVPAQQILCNDCHADDHGHGPITRGGAPSDDELWFDPETMSYA